MRQVLKWINPLANLFGFYTAYTLTVPEFIGVTQSDNLRETLLRQGYEPPPKLWIIPLSAAKTHPVTGDIHAWTLRQIDSDSPRHQYHIHVFTTDTGLSVASHYELRPDLKRIAGETHKERMDRLRTHYRPVWGDEYIRGKAPDSLTSELYQ